MKYLAILGQNPELSLAELSAVYPDIKITPLAKEGGGGRELVEATILESPEKIDINELGGLPKLAELLEDGVAFRDIKKIIVAELLKLGKNQKIFFGLSFYNNANRGLYNGLGREIKNALKDAGGKARWAVSRELALSSVYIKTNKLLTRGFDFDIVFHGGKICVAKTVAVQDFSDYEFRDMRRPRRDLVSGMTPTKLAKTLINLGGQGRESFLDPFCGSGTFLMEAALLGFKKICGSDASDKAVADTKENMSWLQKFYKFNSTIEIKKCRAEEALKCWGGKFDCIATEPYLGPPVRGELAKHKAIDLQKEIGANYEKYLSGLSAVLNPGGCLVLIVPFFITEKGDFFLPLKLKENGLKTVINPILYSRPDQKVGREIYVLKK
ncbi:MAG: RsmD family RNA methyltransferase [bacterium]